MKKQKSERFDALTAPFSNRCFPNLGNIGWCRYTAAQPNTLLFHSHKNAFEICWLKSGSAFWRVGSDLFHVEPGELFLTWPNEVHGGENQVMHPCELYWFVFRLRTRKGSFGLTPSQTAEIDSTLRQLKRRKFRAPPSIADHFKRLFKPFTTPNALYSEIEFNAAVQLLFCDVLLAAPAPGKGRRTAYSPRIQKAVNLLNQEPIVNVAEMANAVGLRPSYFREQFKKETGYSPVEYQTRLRIQKAESLLLDTGRSITHIAYELGFSSSQYFATVFRSQTGQTPRAFRANTGETSEKPKLL